MAIPDSFIDDLVNRTDITDLVSGYVRLTKRSGSSMFGLCPFHSEKTPSFSVNSDRQTYHCFGCGKGGSAIRFIMDIENVSFPDAIEILSKRLGLTVPDDSGASIELSQKRKRVLELNRDAARFFHDSLLSPVGESARSYISFRKISKAMVTKFGIGAAPDAWTLLVDSMTSKGFSTQELIDAGLARKGKNDKGTYDFFRNRLMFPVIDVRGNVIGFSGRIIGSGEPKYLNSPDTIAFNKSRNLFALNFAKNAKSKMLILVEGNLDVIALHQAGFDSAVASLGTSLTADQARLMSRYAQKAVVAFDSDEAGRKATLKALPLLEKTEMAIKVIDMGDAKDPDEYLALHGADAFLNLINRSDNHIEYRLASIRRNGDLESDEGRLAYIELATDIISELDSKPQREVYSARVSEIALISRESVEHEAERKSKLRWAKQKKEQTKRAMNPLEAIQPADKALRYEHEYSASAEEEIIKALVKEPSLMRTIDELGFGEDEFTSSFLRKVFGVIKRRILDGRDTRAALVMTELEENEASQLALIFQKTEGPPVGAKAISKCIEKIRMEKYRTVVPDSDTLLEIKSYREKKDIGGP